MSAPLRAGVLGLGMMGRHHVRILKQMDGVDLVGVADRDGDRYGAAAVAGLVADECLDDLLRRKLDVCVVAVPTDDHGPACRRLAEEGIHTLVEKPLAADLTTGQGVVEAFDRAALVGAVGHVERYNAALQSMRERLAGGALGDIFQVVTRRQGPFPDRIRDVGVVKDLATHDVDLTAWVTGSSYESVFARVAYRAERDHEDLVAVVGRLRDGTVVDHLVNWLSPVKERVVVVTGDRGCFVADMLSADLTFFANAQVPTEWEALSSFRGVSEGDMIRYALPKPEPIASELAAFCAAVRGESTNIVSMAEGLETLRVAEAVLASAAEERVVQLAGFAP